MLEYSEKLEKVLNNINQIIIGKENIVTLSIVALLARGHVLLEDVPGVGKTMLVRALAKSLDCSFNRVQFTPDLLPSDVTGVSIFHPQKLEFEFRSGPIFGNIILADEINRTSPKTQSALLEGMEEQSVTVDGTTMSLNDPFFVMATQNPIEYDGTYTLPEAQLDRFLFKLNMGYPDFNEEMQLLNRSSGDQQLESILPVLSKEDLLKIQKAVQTVYIAENVQRYIVQLATETRNHQHVRLGVSPRGSIALMEAAKAYAYISGREYVLPDDVKYLAPFVFTHRMRLSAEAGYEGFTSDHVIDEIIESCDIPIRKETI
ncbi:AAA family ATPase [Virgibacillus sp. W0181]|uniref:AAA family ATPase n=1 Tax=Virgibacillus sp. W0181 TaxID=3391581 RepID=UPI003F453EBA